MYSKSDADVESTFKCASNIISVGDINAIELMKKLLLAKSNSEARKLISNNGAYPLSINGETVKDFNSTLSKYKPLGKCYYIIKFGKKKAFAVRHN